MRTVIAKASGLVRANARSRQKVDCRLVEYCKVEWLLHGLAYDRRWHAGCKEQLVSVWPTLKRSSNRFCVKPRSLVLGIETPARLCVQCSEPRL